MSRPKLTDVFPDWLTGGGIFTAMQSMSVPWSTDNIASSLDLEYYGNVSGDKYISPAIEKVMEDDELSASEITLFATALVALYGDNWTKQYATLSASYDPIKNYDMTETMTDDETVTDYGKTHTMTNNLTDTATPDLTNETANDAYGFNSTDAVPTGGSTVTASGTNTLTKTGSVTDTDTGSDTQTRNYTLTRSGNIGVTTSQQMIQSEHDLWKWNFFREVVFPNVDEVLALRVY